MKLATKVFIVGAACASVGVFVMAGRAEHPLPAATQAAAVATAPGDEIIVKFKTGAVAAGVEATHSKAAKFAVAARRGIALGAEVVRFATKRTPTELQAIVAEYRKDPNVEYAEVNGIMTIQQQVPKLTPLLPIGPIILLPFCPGSDDPQYPNLWGIKKIKADCAWDTNIGAGNIKVAVVDTGVDYNHEDLAGTVIKGYDFVNNDNDPKDDQGHGTHVAGTIAATINNNKGVVGVGPNVKILAVKVLNNVGSGTWSQVANGIIYAADNGARVINLSLGGGSSQTVKNAVDYAWSKGVLLACAAGNGAPTTTAPGYPAAYPSCLAVAATDQNDQRAGFSQYAPNGVAAPGLTILSTTMGNAYGNKSGTSMATPHVAGLAGLLFAQNPNRTNVRVRQILTATTDDIGAPGKDGIFGFGRINAQKAVTYQCTGNSCP
jgi:thermitase